MATTRAVKFTVLKPDGTAYPNAQTIFTLEPTVLDAANLYPAMGVTVTANGSGVTTANLIPGTYTVDFPSGERHRITVPEGSGDLQLTDLLTADLAMDDDEWAAYKRAVREYSAFRPRIVPEEEWAPTAGVVKQTVGDEVIGIEYINYGEWASLSDIYTGVDGEQGWNYNGEALYLFPAPASGTTVLVLWQQAHAPVDATRTCPTIPLRDLHIVSLLKMANEAEVQQAAIDMGLSSYTIGGTTVKWSQQSGGTTTGTTLSQRLRAMALAAIQEPYSTWG